jgi:Zn-dependent protease
MFTFALLLAALFTCVVLHEFGHALAARRYGVSTKDITLSPIGGVARLNRLPEKPVQEFVVAIAGPLVNIAIGLAIGIVFLIFSIRFLPRFSTNPTQAFSNPDNFFQWLFFLNIVLAVFNLLPAFPMDGGRMLRSLLSIKLGRLKATRVASLIGRVIAILLLMVAIYNGDILFGFVSLFVFFMAAHEYYMVRMDDVLANKNIGDLNQQSDFTLLRSEAKMKTAIDIFSKGNEKNFLVLDEAEKLCGVLEEQAIQMVINGEGIGSQIKNHVKNINGAVLLDDRLGVVYSRMDNPIYRVLPIYDAGALVGVIDLDRLNRFVKKKVRTRFAI